MSEVLKIQIGADVEQAVANIQKFAKTLGVEIGKTEGVLEAFERELNNVESSLKSLSGNALLNATARVQALKTAISQIKTNSLVGGLNNIRTSAGGATRAAVDFGRITQDLSFGFIGVANNIEPFILSLKNLKAEAGSTGGAIKSFFSSLAGPAGVGVLIGAISLFDSYSKGYGIFAGRAKEAATAQKDFNKELDEARASAISTGAQLQSLLSIASDTTQSDKTRNAALKELNKTTKDYGINIDAVAIASGTASAQVDELTKSLIAQAVAAKLADKIADLVIAQSKAIEEYSKQRQLLEQRKPLADALGNVQQVAGGFAQGSVQIAGAGKALGEYSQSLNATKSASQAYRQITNDLQNTYKLLNEQTRIALRFVKDDTDAKNGAAAATKRLSDANKELNQNPGLVTPNAKQEQVPLNDFPQTLDELEKINGVVKDLGQTAFGQILDPAIKDAADQAFLINTAFGAISPLVDQAFNALANGQDVFQSLQQGVKRLIVDLIKAVALAAILSALPGGGAASATGLTATVGKLLGLKGFRANGGPVGGGSPFIVGERGPELFVPNQSGRIINNANLLGAGGGMQIIPTLEFSYDQLRIAFNRANASAGRRF